MNYNLQHLSPCEQVKLEMIRYWTRRAHSMNDQQNGLPPAKISILPNCHYLVQHDEIFPSHLSSLGRQNRNKLLWKVDSLREGRGRKGIFWFVLWKGRSNYEEKGIFLRYWRDEKKKKSWEDEVCLSCDLRLIELPFPSPVSDDQEAEGPVGLGRALKPRQLRGAREEGWHHRRCGKEDEGQSRGLERDADHGSDKSREERQGQWKEVMIRWRTWGWSMGSARFYRSEVAWRRETRERWTKAGGRTDPQATRMLSNRRLPVDP